MKGLLLCYLVLINTSTFFFMYYDKYMAKTGQWRVPEKVLFNFVLAGGGIGGCIGMKICRHKTRKGMFLLGFPAITIVEYVLILIIFIM